MSINCVSIIRMLRYPAENWLVRYNKIVMKGNSQILGFIVLVVVFHVFLAGICRASEPVRLGVLEFENITGDSEFNWVSRGIQESLSSKLAALPNVIVIERGQINKILEEQRLQMSGFVDTDTAVEVGKVIGIKKAVTGSYQVSSSAILINARVIDVETAETDEGFEVQGGVDDIFSHYSRLATDLSGSFGDEAGAQGSETHTIAQPAQQEIARQDTTSFSAYEYYIKANEVAFGSDSWITAMIDMIDKGKEIDESEEINREAVELFEKAVDIDPNYARAWALLALGYSSLQDYTSSENAMRTALSLASDDPFILCTEGLFRSFVSERTGGSTKALAAFKQVRRDFPGTYYAGLSSLFIVLIELTEDEEWMLAHTGEGLSLLTDARANMPEAGFVRAFHGMFAIIQLFTELESTFTDENIELAVVSDAKSRLDTAVNDIDKYVQAYPGSMIAPDIGTFLPDAKALQSMFSALEVVLTIQERAGGDPSGMSLIPEQERMKYKDRLARDSRAMQEYVNAYPYGMLVDTINADVLPAVDVFIQSLEGGGSYPQGGGMQGSGQEFYNQPSLSLDDGIIAASDLIINDDPWSAMDILVELDEAYPDVYDVYYLMVLALIGVEDYESSAELLFTITDLWPNEPDPYYWLGAIYDYSDDPVTAYDYYLAYLSLAPDGQFAEDAYNRALEIESYYSY